VSEPLRVVALGWGAQSFGLAVMSAVGDLPMVDAAIFADTTYESKGTYAYIAKHRQWLADRGVNYVEVVDPSVGDPVDQWGAVFIPAFTKHRDSHEPAGPLRRQCTGRWKIDPIRRWCQEHRAKGQPVELYLGITLDEVGRMKPSRVKYITNVYPFIERGMERYQVVQYLEKAGVEIPPRSACVFCPYRSRSAMKAVMADPEDRAVAVKMDDAIREKRRGYLSYVRRELEPLDEMDFDEGQLDMFGEECEGYCGL
jgi:hypothetical protein